MVRLREAVLQEHVRQGPAGGKNHSEHTDLVTELQGGIERSRSGEKKERVTRSKILPASNSNRSRPSFVYRLCKYISKLRKTDLPENSPSDSKRLCKRPIS